MGDAVKATEPSIDPADPAVERELTSRLLRRNMGVRSLLLLIWPIYAVLDAGRSPWWLFVALAALHIVGRLGYPRLDRDYGADPDRRPLGQWQLLHLALTLWNGLAVGLGAALVALSADPPVRFALCLLLIIMSLGSPSRAYAMRSYAGYVFALLAPMSVALVVAGDVLSVILGAVCLPPFGLGLLLVARGQQRFAREMIAVTLSHERLLRRFEEARGEGEEARTILQTALNALSEAVFLYAPDGKLLLLNDAAYHIHGIDRGLPLIGRNFREFVEAQAIRGDFGPLDATAREAAIADRLEQFRRGTDGWLSARRRDRWLELSTSVLPDGHRLIVHRDVTDLKNSETAANEARATLQTALNALSDAVILYGSDGRLLFLNDVARGTMGKDKGDRVIGSTVRELIEMQIANGEFGQIGPAEQAAEIALREKLFAEGTNGWHPLRRRDRWFEASVVILADGRRLVVNRDVTDLKSSETAATEATAKLIAAMESMAGGIAFIDAEERLELCNEAFKKFMNYDPAICTPGVTLEAANRHGSMRLPAEIREQTVQEALRRHRAGESVLMPFGDNQWARMVMRQTGDGRATLLVTDVTGERQRQRELETALAAATDSRAKLVAAMESMADGIAFFDAEDRLELCNEAYKRFMGDNPDLYKQGVPLSKAVVVAAYAGAVPADQTADWIADTLLNLRTGDPILFRFGKGQWARALARSTGGRTTLLVTDITEQRRRQRELERALESAEAARAESDAANQAKSTFLATMSHEIRTPMNGVLGMIEVLGREQLNDDQRDLVHTMRDSAGAVLRLLDDLLDFSKIEAGRTDLEAAAFSLSSVVERASDNFRAAAAAKGVNVSVAIAPGSADALIGDPTRVRQIVANLIGNAVKFTERGAVIVRALTRPLGEGRTEVEISVSDTGIGMDEAQLAGLFRPFAQADSGTTRRYGGTGLGLSIVRRLAQLMDGDVKAQSAPGVGSTFTVTVILMAAPADSPLVELQTLSAPAGSDIPVAPTVSSRARVLVVDDHPVNLKVALRQLASLGIAADTAANGREGLERWRAGDYALILADVHMPDMDGFEMTALIRREEISRARPRTPIVASTANAMKGEDERCRAAGMDGYLAKPVETERLRAVIERWLPAVDQSVAGAGSTPGAAGDDPGILDRAVLSRWSGGDAAFERDLLDTFEGELEQSEHDIDAALRAGDLARVAQAAHRLKGSALQIGASRAGAAALALEEAGKAADRQRCQDARGHLAAELRRLAPVLQSVGGTNI